MLELFLALVFVHFVFDFCLQSKFMSDYKGKLPFVMFVHVFVWTWAVCMMAGFYGTLPYWAIPFLFIGHWIADAGKIRMIEKENLDGADEKNQDVLSRLKFLFHADQVWHLMQLAIITIVVMV